ncbi:MAG: glycosyltransferase family 2 protein [Halanaeroarchaeum sp.]
MIEESTASTDTSPPELSVVVITENEEDKVERCIESIFAACQTVPAFEIVLVDSASTDRTVELASEYPITVLRIPESDTVSCGAGRYVGDQYVAGEMVLHVDGDMELTESWLPLAIEHLRSAEDVAAVEGNLDEPTQGEIREVDKVGGVMLYDADALRSVGGFDPFLLGYEDVDVGFRLRDAGYRLLRLPEVSAIHHDEGGMSEPIRRWRQGYLIAPGQTIRKSITSPFILSRLVRRQRYKLLLAAWVLIGGISVISGPLSLLWLILSVVGFGVVVSHRGGLSEAIQFLSVKGFGVVGLVLGFARPLPPGSEYPVDDVEVVTTGPIHRPEQSRHSQSVDPVDGPEEYSSR